MPLLKARIVAETPFGKRTLFLLKENTKGDVYITHYSGFQKGLPPDNILAKQDRYSIHPSMYSPVYTTLKHTVVYEGGHTTGGTSLTNAVKLKQGFGTIFAHRATDLKDDMHNIDGRYPIYSIGGYNPDESFLLIGAVISHPEVELPQFNEFQSSSLLSTQFRVTFFWYIFMMPSIPFAVTLDKMTIRPEVWPGSEAMMDSEPASRTADLFLLMAFRLIENYLQTIVSIVEPDEKTAEIYRKALSSVSTTASLKDSR